MNNFWLKSKNETQAKLVISLRQLYCHEISNYLINNDDINLLLITNDDKFDSII